MKIISAALLLVSTLAYANAPICGAIGSRSEGWVMDGHLVKYANCAQQVAKCGAFGTEAEGWYANDKVAEGLLGWENCQALDSTPQCGAIGTRSEGWVYRGKLMKYDNCADKIVECGAIGTRSEGWYIYSLKPAALIVHANCPR